MATPVGQPEITRPLHWVALFRPLEEARASAQLLRRRGYGVAFAPVLRVASTGASPKASGYDGVLATSARAFVGLGAELSARLRQMPLYVVGAHTGEAARLNGFAKPLSIGRDAADLIGQLKLALPTPRRLLYLAGRERTPQLEQSLAQSGHQVEVVEVYNAGATAAWTSHEIAQLASCAAMLHYSPRSAALAISLAQAAGLGEIFGQATHVCLSKAAALPIANAGLAHIALAREPQETALFEALDARIGAQR